MRDFVENTKGYKVLTPNGYQNFGGIALMGVSPVVKLTLDDGTILECTEEHKVYQEGYLLACIDELYVGCGIITVHGIKKVVSIEVTDRKEPVYDLIEVEGGHRYFTNGVLSSNCKFVSGDDLLIDGTILNQISGVDPLVNKNGVRWFSDPKPNHTYVAALDPAMGNNGDRADYAAIQVFELPTMRQVAEWNDKSIPVEGQISLLRQILITIHSVLRRHQDQTEEPAIYWSVENNGLGEAALLAIRTIGEENFPGYFIHEPRQTGGGRLRKGLWTGNSNKVTACSRLKSFVETGRMKLVSRLLISQLKTFVGTGNTYKAKIGEHDDLVMATVICVRIIQIISSWDPDIENVVNQLNSATDDEYGYEIDGDLEPMPFTFI